MDATNLLSRKNIAVLFVVFTDADEDLAFEFADSHTAETATELHKPGRQLWRHKERMVIL